MITGILEVAFYVLIVVLLFSLAIFIHEFGHFLAARWLGLTVDAFSIGFGPAIWKKTINGTEYKICWILFGGFVALPQLDPSGMNQIQGDYSDKREQTDDSETPAEGEGESSEEPTPARILPEIAAWKRIVVAFAGPFGNVVLAVILAFVLYAVPAARIGLVDTRVGMIETNSVAYAEGLRSGDRIDAVNGTPVHTWSDLFTRTIQVGDNETATFSVTKADGSQATYEIALDTNNVVGAKLLAGVSAMQPCQIAEVEAGSPAAAAGFRKGDTVLSVNGNPIYETYHFIEWIIQNGEKPVSIVIQRDGKELTLDVTPTMKQVEGEEKPRAMIGVHLADATPRMWMMYRDPWQQLWWDTQSVFNVLRSFVAPKQKGERKAVAKQIGGPVTIVVSLYKSVKGSFWDAWGFLRMICINLAILNLLPLPVLDGGHICFALFEIITRRKPHPKFVAVVTNVFAFLLIGLMLFLIFRDVVLQARISRHESELLQQLDEETTSGAETNAAAVPATEK
ncbi:MAG: RIP metalloprotease RseP [Kiritimatiellae bacterium]|nr:RIP metalloprotease RseP [Kiritimatiellia bacterium]